MIDLRSDTVTRPTPEMREAMLNAVTGDDVFQEDPEINELQYRCANMFGMEAGLFCPSGTMTNQIAISVHTSRGDEVICDELSHVYNYEGGGIARLAGASVKLIKGDRGRFTAEDVVGAINPEDSHYANTSLVCLEDTCNKGGGAVWDLDKIASVSSIARDNGLGVHLDGARLWNALVAREIQNDSKACAKYGNHFDSISLCFSKGLGCPVGSVLIGSNDFIAQAHRQRKVFGGGMRQAGVIAAAGIFALDNHIDRLAEDNKNARLLGNAALNYPGVKSYSSIDTNIVILHLEDGVDSSDIVGKWGDMGIHCFPFSKSSIRLVTHLDLSNEQVDQACNLLCGK